MFESQKMDFIANSYYFA